MLNIGGVYMVQAMINISKEANQILNIVKARHNMRDKSEAIDLVVKEYGDGLMEPELRPEFVEKMKLVEKEKIVRIGTLSDFKRHYGLK
jgi:hypothetical protein